MNRQMTLSVAALLTYLSTANAGLSVEQTQSLTQFIYDQKLNICDDGQPHKLAQPPSLKELGTKCDGKDLYVLVLETLRFKMKGGAPADCSSSFTGSGGTLTPILTWNAQKKRFDPLFMSNVIQIWDTEEKDRGKNCPAMPAKIHHVNFLDLPLEQHEAFLELHPGTRKYRLRIRNIQSGAPIRWVDQ